MKNRFFAVLALFLLFPLLSAAEKFEWEKNSRELYPGFRYAFVELTEPRPLKIHLARIDLKTPGLKIKTTAPDQDYGKPMPDYTKKQLPIRTKRQTVKAYMESERAAGENMIFAVNANYWSPFEEPWNHKYAANLDFAVSNGKVIECKPGRPCLIVYRDGRVEMRKSEKDEPVAEIAVGVCGFNFVMQDGKPLTPVEGRKYALAPRTAGGLSQDGRYLYYLVVDGRQEDFSMGMNIIELGEWMERLGAWTGINFDGGGSSSFVVWDGKEAKMLNHQPRGGMRAVANAVGFCLDPPTGK